MTLAILGAGSVGTTLGAGFARAGHAIVYGVRDPDAAKHAPLRAAGARVTTMAGAVEGADAVILATPWAAAEAALKAAGDLGGRPLLDATNPIGPGFALTHGHTDSGGEQVARWAPSARVVKVFNTTGTENMADPRYGAARAAMFVCGDDADACALAVGLAGDLGFQALRVGPLAKARVLEPAAMVWTQLALALGNGRNIALGVATRGSSEEAGVRPLTPAAAATETAPDAAAATETAPGPRLRVAILGHGHIGAGLGRAWARAGHDVVFGARNPEDAALAGLCAATGARAATVAAATDGADVVALAVPYGALDDVLAAAGPLTGAVVIDCTNAVGPGMTLRLGHTTSAAEALQARLPGARVVKSFNAQGAENLANPVYPLGVASNFYCGDDPAARAVVRGLVADVGFDPVDTGPLKNARYLEPLMLLWVSAAQGLATRDLAFRLLRR